MLSLRKSEAFVRSVVDVQLVSAIGPPGDNSEYKPKKCFNFASGGGKNPLSSRLTRYFALIGVEPLSKDALGAIICPYHCFGSPFNRLFVEPIIRVFFQEVTQSTGPILHWHLCLKQAGALPGSEDIVKKVAAVVIR